MSRVPLPRQERTEVMAALSTLGAAGVALGRAGAGLGVPGQAANRAGRALGGLLLLAALGGLGVTLWQGPGLLLRPGPFLFGLAIGWLTYWALRHQQTDGLVRLIGGVVSVAATAATAAAATQGTPVFGAPEFALYLQGFAVGFFLYFLTVLACALLAHGTVAAAAAWLIGKTDQAPPLAVHATGQESPPAQNGPAQTEGAAAKTPGPLSPLATEPADLPGRLR